MELDAVVVEVVEDGQAALVALAVVRLRTSGTKTRTIIFKFGGEGAKTRTIMFKLGAKTLKRHKYFQVGGEGAKIRTIMFKLEVKALKLARLSGGEGAK